MGKSTVQFCCKEPQRSFFCTFSSPLYDSTADYLTVVDLYLWACEAIALTQLYAHTNISSCYQEKIQKEASILYIVYITSKSVPTRPDSCQDMLDINNTFRLIYGENALSGFLNKKKYTNILMELGETASDKQSCHSNWEKRRRWLKL